MSEKGLGCRRFPLNFAKVFRTVIERASWSAATLVKALKTKFYNSCFRFEFCIGLFSSLQEKWFLFEYANTKSISALF